MTQLQALNNAANNSNLSLRVYEMPMLDKRKSVKKFFLQIGIKTISPVLNYENMNHFILGFLRAEEILTNSKNL